MSGAKETPGATNTIIGVDVQPHTIRMVKLRRSENGRPKVLGWRAHWLPKPLEFGDDGHDKELGKALRSFCGVTDERPQIWASMRAHQVRSMTLELPQMDSAKLGSAIYWAIKRENPFEDSESVLDYEVANPKPERPEDPLQVTAYLAPRQTVSIVRRSFEEAGFPLTGLSLPMSVFNNYIRAGWLQSSKVPVAVSITGMDSTQVGVTIGGHTALTRNIPAGINQLSEAAVKELPEAPTLNEVANWITRANVERKDKQTGAGVSDDNYIEALRRPMERLARHIEQTIEYFHRNQQDQGSVSSVYTFGLVAANTPIRKYLNRRLDVEINPFDPMANELFGKSPSPPDTAEERVPYGMALGLALSVDDKTPNFLYTYKDREISQRRRLIGRITLASTAALLALCAGFGGWQYQQLASLRDDRSQLERTVSSHDPHVDEGLLRLEAGHLIQRQQHLKNAAMRHQSSALISEIARQTPAGIELTSIQFSQQRTSQTTGRNRSTSPSISIVVEGMIDRTAYATESQLALYTTALRSSPLITQVDMDSGSSSERRSETHNSFTLRIVPTTGFMTAAQ